jgi:hypothetical protein
VAKRLRESDLPPEIPTVTIRNNSCSVAVLQVRRLRQWAQQGGGGQGVLTLLRCVLTVLRCVLTLLSVLLTLLRRRLGGGGVGGARAGGAHLLRAGARGRESSLPG